MSESGGAHSAANRDAAAEALARGREFRARGELDRAMRFFRRSFALVPTQDASAAVQETLAAMERDARFCVSCASAIASCSCPPQWALGSGGIVVTAALAAAQRCTLYARRALSGVLRRVGVSPLYIGSLEIVFLLSIIAVAARLLFGAPLINLLLPAHVGNFGDVAVYSGGVIPSIFLTVAVNAVLWTVRGRRH